MNPAITTSYRMPAFGDGNRQARVANHGVVSRWSKIESRENAARPGDDHVIG